VAKRWEKREGERVAEATGGGIGPLRVSAMQYAKGWDLVSTGHTAAQVLAGTGMSRAQLTWCLREGSEADGMPSYSTRLLEVAAKMRGRAMEAAEEVGAQGVEGLRRQLGIVKIAQQIVAMLLNDFGRALAENAQLPAGSRRAIGKIVPPRNVIDALRALKPYTDLTDVAHAFRAIYDSPHQRQDPLSGLPREARIDLSAEAVLPASVSLLDGVGASGPATDAIDDLLPDYRGWTEEDIDHYLATGERPDRGYGIVSIGAEEPSPEDFEGE